VFSSIVVQESDKEIGFSFSLRILIVKSLDPVCHRLSSLNTLILYILPDSKLGEIFDLISSQSISKLPVHSSNV
jgi:hypothetical protein